MTEAEWLAVTDVVSLWGCLREQDKLADRRCRLFEVACCHRVAHFFSSEDGRPVIEAALRFASVDLGACDPLWRAIEVAERFADGEASERELATAYKAANDVGRTLDPPNKTYTPNFTDPTEGERALHQLVRAMLATTFVTSQDVTAGCGSDFAAEVLGTGERDERAVQAELLRDIFGNPFRPVTFAPEWRTSTAVTLSAQMYVSRDFSAIPILADALQDAGCDNTDILNHCRGPGPHVRGCWMVDLVLGKE